MSERPHSHFRSPHWAAEGISEPFLQNFWGRLWDSWRDTSTEDHLLFGTSGIASRELAHSDGYAKRLSEMR